MNIKTEPKPACPKCGAVMVLRRPRDGATWKPFWGCPLFHADECDGTRNIDPDTGEAEQTEREYMEQNAYPLFPDLE